MNTAAEYLEKTESATRHLFTAIEEYLGKLREGVVSVQLPIGSGQRPKYQEWCQFNLENLEYAQNARRDFRAESFALSTICGAVLQIAAKGLEIYSTNTSIRSAPPELVNRNLAKYCVGRRVQDIPLGLIIYAGRNQHTHFNEENLNKLNAYVFQVLANNLNSNEKTKHPAFDLTADEKTSRANHTTALINWRSFEQYQDDMRCMLLTNN